MLKRLFGLKALLIAAVCLALHFETYALDVELEHVPASTGEKTGLPTEDKPPLPFELHGDFTPYLQYRDKTRIAGESISSETGSGFAANIALSFEPIRDGSVFLRAHAGEGDGADYGLDDTTALHADLNTLNDDNPEEGGIDLLEAFYEHHFLDEVLGITFGKTEGLRFLDGNAFANDEYTQFVGKAFVNNPVLDAENEYAPLAAFTGAPSEMVNLAAVVQSSSYPLADEAFQKDESTQLFRRPFVGGQLEITPGHGTLGGAYRLYGWLQNYEHARIDRDGETRGWGVGTSVDQTLSETVGVFGRAAYSNKDVYAVPVFLSGGINLTGIIPARENDTIGIGYAAMHSNSALPSCSTESQVEAYYRFRFNDHFSLSTHLQLVANPQGDAANNDIIGGMVRLSGAF